MKKTRWSTWLLLLTLPLLGMGFPHRSAKQPSKSNAAFFRGCSASKGK